MYVQRFGSQLQLPFSSEKRKQQPSPAGVKNGIMLHSVAKTALLGIFSIISFLPSIWLSTDQSHCPQGSLHPSAGTEHKAAGWIRHIPINSRNSMSMLASGTWALLLILPQTNVAAQPSQNWFHLTQAHPVSEVLEVFVHGEDKG